jgi:hypothetical protein
MEQAITPKPRWKRSKRPDRTIQVAKQIKKVMTNETTFFVLRTKAGERLYFTME